MSDNIIVAVRVRPLITREESDKNKIHWEVDEIKNSIVQIDPSSRKKLGSPYVYDKVFSSNSSTDDVHNSVTKPIVESALSGFNGTIFAYGQTSSGKTYTMTGNQESQGIIPLAVKDIFDTIENTPDREYLIRASYMEIYNENITDLLGGKECRNKGLSIREDGAGIVYVADLKEMCVIQEAQLLNLIKKGDKYRHVGSTNMNERSSRSHSIFRLIIESRERGDGLESEDSAVTVSHLNLVDLAGSENVSQTGATGDRLKEGGFINKSLFMLGRVISQLSDGETFINFRDSKLTRILQASLGGNAKTAIICTVTPAGIDQTHSTLRFASRAKSVKNKPIVNEVLSDAALLKRYMREIGQLKEALENEKKTNKAQEVEMVKEKLDEQERRNKDLQDKIKQLSEKMIVSSHALPVHQVKVKKKNRRETWAAPAIQRLMRKSVVGMEIERLHLEHDFLKPAVPPLKRELPFIKEDLNISDVSQSGDDISEEAEGALGVNMKFGTPDGVAKRRRKKKVHFESIPSSPVKSFCSVECQTNESLLPKFRNSISVQSPSGSNSMPQGSSPGTPVHVLRTRNADLQMKLERKTECLDNMEEELKEMRAFHATELDLKEESFRAKICEGADLDYIQELKEKIKSLEHSQRDTEGLLMDANKALSFSSQELVLCREECEHLKSALHKHSSASVELEDLKTKFDELSSTLLKKSEQLDQMEKERQDFDTMMELTLQKKSVIEKDLRRSLQDAWGEIAVLEGSTQGDVQRRWEQLQTLEKELATLREETSKQSDSTERITLMENQLADLTKKLEESDRKISEYEMEKETNDKLIEKQASELEELRLDLQSSKVQDTDLVKGNQRRHSSLAEKYEESLLEDPEVDGRPSIVMSSSLTRRRKVRLSHLEVSNRLSETLQVLEESILNSSLVDPQSPDFITLPIGLSDLEMLKNELLVLQEALITQERESNMTKNIAYQPWVVADYETVVAVWKMQEDFCADYLLYSYSQPLYTENVSSALDIDSVAQGTVKTKKLIEYEENLQKPQTASDAPPSQALDTEEYISYRNTACTDVLPLSLADELREVDMDITLNINEVLRKCDVVTSDPLQEIQSLRERLDIITKENLDLSEEVQQLKGKLQDNRSKEEYAHREKILNGNESLAEQVLLQQELQEHKINEEEIHCLRWKVDSLKTEKEELDTHKEKLQNENESLAEQVLLLEQEVQEHKISEEEIHCLRWKIDSLKTEKEELDAQLTLLNKESVKMDLYEEVKKELFKAKETIKSLEEITTNTTELDEKEEEMERLITDFMMKEEKYEHDIENLDKERAKLKRQVIDEESKMKQLDKKFIEQEDKLKISLDLIAAKEKENETLMFKLEEEKMKEEFLLEKLAKCQDEIVRLIGLPDSRTDLEKLLSEELVKKNIDLVALENALADLKEVFSQKERELSVLEKITKDCNEELKSDNIEANSFNREDLKTNKSVLEDEKQVSHLNMCNEGDMSQKDDEQDTFKEKYSKLAQELEKKKSEEILLKQTLAELREGISAEEDKRNGVEQISEGLRGEVKEKDETQTRLESRLLDLEKELKEVNLFLEDKKQEYSRMEMLLEEELAKKSDRQVSLEEKLKEVTNLLEKKDADLVTLENALANLKEESSQKEKEFSALEQVMKTEDNLEVENLNLEKNLKDTQASLQEEKQEVSRLNLYIKEELSKKDDEQDTFKENYSKLAQELEKKKSEEILLQQTLAELREEMSAEEAKRNGIEQICNDLRGEVKEKGEVQTRLELRLVDLEEELKSVNLILEDKKNESTRLETLEEELAKKSDQQVSLEEKLKEVTNLLEKKDADVVTLENALANLKEESSQKEKEFSALEQVMKTEDNLEAENLNLEKNLKVTLASLQEEKQEVSRLNLYIKEELSKKDYEQDNFKEKYSKLAQELEKKKSEEILLQQTLAELREEMSAEEDKRNGIEQICNDLRGDVKEKGEVQTRLELRLMDLEEELKSVNLILEDKKQESTRLETLEEELTKKSDQQVSLEEKLKEVTNLLEKKDANLVTLENALSNLKEESSQKEKEFSALEQVMEDLKEKLKKGDTLEAENLNLEKNLKDTQASLQEEKQEVSRLNLYIKEELSKKDDEQDNFKEKYSKLAQELEKKKSEEILLQQTLAELREEMSAEEDKRNGIEQICNDLRGEVKEKGEVQTRLESRLLDLEKELKDVNLFLEGNKQESSRLEMLEEELTKKNDQQVSLEEKLKELTDLLEKKDTDMVALENALSNLKEEFSQKEREFSALEQVVEDLKEKLKKGDILETENLNLEKNLKVTQASLQEEKQEVSRLNLYIKEELSKKNCEQDILNEKCKKLSQELISNDDEKVTLEQALADSKELVAKKEKEQNVCEQICDTLRGELKEKDKVQATSEAKILNLEKELKATHSRLEDERQETSRLAVLLKEESAKKNDQQTVYEEKWKEVNEKFAKKSTEMILLEKAYGDLKQDYNKKEKEKIDLRKANEDLYKTLREKDVGQNSLEADLENAKEELCQVNKGKEVMVALHEEELQKHKDETKDLRREIDVVKREVLSMKTEMDELTKEKFVLEDSNSKLNEEIKEVIQKHNMEIDALAQRETQLEREMKAMQDCLAEKNIRHNKPDKTEIESEIMTGAKMELLQEKLMQIEKELEEKKIILDDKTQECKKLTKEVENLTACCKMEKGKIDLSRQTSSLNRDAKKNYDGNGECWYSQETNDTNDVVRNLGVRLSHFEKEQDEDVMLEGTNRECELGEEMNAFRKLERKENSSIQMGDLNMQVSKEVENMTTGNLSIGVSTHFQENNEMDQTNVLIARISQLEDELIEKKDLLEKKNKECQQLDEEMDDLVLHYKTAEGNNERLIEDLRNQVLELESEIRKQKQNSEEQSFDGVGSSHLMKKVEKTSSGEKLRSKLFEFENELEKILEKSNEDCMLITNEVVDFVKRFKKESCGADTTNEGRVKTSASKEDLVAINRVEYLDESIHTLHMEKICVSKWLQARVTKLRNELEKREQILEEKNKKCKFLTNEKENGSDTQIQELKGQVSLLEKELDKVLAENRGPGTGHYDGIGSESSITSEELQARVIHLESELKGKERLLEEKNNECKRLDEEMDDLVAHYKEEEKNSDSQIEDLRQQVSALEEELRKVGIKKRVVDECSHPIREEEQSFMNKELQAQTVSLENKLKKREEVLEEKINECKHLTDLVGHYKDKEKANDTQVQVLRKQVVALKEELKNAVTNETEDGIIGLEHHVEMSNVSEGLQGQVNKLENELKKKEKMLEEKDKECKRLDEEMDDLVAHYKEEEKKSDSQIEDLRRQVSALEEKMKKHHEPVVEGQHHVVFGCETSSSYEELHARITHLESELEGKERLLDEKNSECKRLDEEMDDLVAHYKEEEKNRDSRIEDHGQQVSALEEELSIKKRVVDECSHPIREEEQSFMNKELQAQTVSLENKLQKREKSLEEKINECKHLTDLVGHYKDKEKANDTQVQVLRKQVVALKEELKNAVTNEKEDGTRGLEHRVGNVETSNMSEELQGQVNKLENELKKKEKMLEEKDKECKRLDEEMDDLVAHYKEEEKKSDSQIEDLRRQVSALEEELKKHHEPVVENYSPVRDRALKQKEKYGNIVHTNNIASRNFRNNDSTLNRPDRSIHTELKTHDEQKENGMQKEDKLSHASALEEGTESVFNEETVCGDDSHLSLEGSGMKFIGRLSLTDSDGSCQSHRGSDMKCVEKLSFSHERVGKSEEVRPRKYGSRSQVSLTEENATPLGQMKQEIKSGSDETFYKILRENNVLKLRLKAMNAPALKELESMKAELLHSNEKVKHLKAELRRIQSLQNMNTTICEINAHRVMAAPTKEPGGGSSKHFNFSGGQSGVVLEDKVIDLQNQMYHFEKDMNKLKKEKQVLEQHVEHFKGKAVEWKGNCLDARHRLDKCEEKLVDYEQENQTYQKKIEEENTEKVQLQFTIGHQRELIEKLEREQLELKRQAEKNTEPSSRIVNKNVLQEHERNAQGNVTEDGNRSRSSSSLPQRMDIGGIREKLPVKSHLETSDGLQKENKRELGQQKPRAASGAATENRIPAKYLMTRKSSSGQGEDECKTQ
ncbi:uncharacterized protein LOC143030935 [Oratosquilla oratoria]|uniref:uncharacterized protein LOC143030935 n=1 Tax=Oratosquilla oratoria TaxID=337810 RepID=UPI003F766702